MPERARGGIGPGRTLVAVYGLFALSAGARSAVQIATKFHHAPLAYLLSALAAAVYLVAAVSLAHPSGSGWRTAVGACALEATGVVAVGACSLAFPHAFPDATVWSSFGQGYGYVPAVLPFVGLAWLLRGTTRTTFRGATTPAGP